MSCTHRLTLTLSIPALLHLLTIYLSTLHRAPVAQRTFSSGTVSKADRASRGFREKTMMEAWASDAGAYPVMGVIAFAVVFSLGTGAYYLASAPDARINKSGRKNIFRGELRGPDGVAQ
jgi:hypothetical protein